jgi:hypothetical protein
LGSILLIVEVGLRPCLWCCQGSEAGFHLAASSLTHPVMGLKWFNSPLSVYKYSFSRPQPTCTYRASRYRAHYNVEPSQGHSPLLDDLCPKLLASGIPFLLHSRFNTADDSEGYPMLPAPNTVLQSIHACHQTNHGVDIISELSRMNKMHHALHKKHIPYSLHGLFYPCLVESDSVAAGWAAQGLASTVAWRLRSIAAWRVRAFSASRHANQVLRTLTHIRGRRALSTQIVPFSMSRAIHVDSLGWTECRGLLGQLRLGPFTLGWRN